MAIPISNVSSSSDTFLDWLDKTNQLLDNLSNKVVTTEANSSGGVTSGNAYVNGSFSANTITVIESLRGGTVGTSNTLTITSNTRFTNATANIFVLTSNSSTSILTSNVVEVTFNATNTNIATGLLRVTSNTTLSGTIVTVNANTANIAGNTLAVSSNVSVNNASLSVNAANVTFTGANFSLASNATLTGLLSVSGDTTFTSGLVTYSGNVAVSTNTLFVDSQNKRVGIGNSTPDSELTVTGTANVSLAVNIGANVSANVSALKIGNSTVNTIISSGEVRVGSNVISNTSAVRVGGTATNVSIQTGQIDVGANLTITVSGISVGNSTVNTTISATGVTLPNSATFSAGNTTISGFINVSSTANIGGVLSARANVVANGQLIVANSASISNNLTVSGNTSVSGATTLSGNLAVNTNVLFVDSSSGIVAVNSSNTANTLNRLSVNGNTSISANLYVQNRIVTDVVECNTFIVSGNLTFTGTSAGSIIPDQSDVFSLGNTTNRWILFASSGNFANDVSITGKLTASANVDITSALNIGSSITASDTTLRIGNSTVNSSLSSNAVNVGGNVVVNTTIVRVGGTATNVTIQTGQISVGANVTANVSAIQIGNSSVNAVLTSTILNLGNSSANSQLSGSSLTVGGVINSGNTTVSGFSNATTQITVGTARSTLSFNPSTTVNPTNDVITIAGHGLVNNDVITYLVAVGNTAIAGLSNNTNYFVREANSTTFKVSLTHGGAAIDITSNPNQTGHSFITRSATIQPDRISVGNSTVNTTITPDSILTSGSISFTNAISAGNTTITGFANISTTLAAGNTTISGFINVSSTANIGGVLSARANVVANGQLIVANAANLGNTTVTGFINVSSTANIGGVLSARANVVANGQLIVANTADLGNTTVSGFANVVSLLSVGTARSTITFNPSTTVNPTNDVITIAGHGLVNNDVVTYSTATGNTVIGGLSNNTNYFVRDANSSTFRISTTLGGAAIDLTSNPNQTGHSFAISGVSIETNRISVGNSTVNTVITAQGLTLPSTATFAAGNTTINGFANVINTLAAGNTTITGFVNVSSSVDVGVVQVNTTAVRVGNSTSNSVLVHNQLKVGNTTVDTTINPAVINVGANASINVSAFKIGNTVSNAVLVQDSLIIQSNASVNAVVSASGLSIQSNSTVNSSLTATTLTVATVSATTLQGNGSSITSLNAGNLTTGTVATARLGTGTANSTTFLRGDQSWQEIIIPDTTTNLGTSANTTTRTVTSSSGDDVVLPGANATQAGVMTSTDKTKLDGIASGAQPGTVTSIQTSTGITGGTITTSGTISLTGQALALHNLATNGLIVRTAADTINARSIAPGTGVTVTNGDGISGNPTIAIGQEVATTSKPQFLALGIGTAAGTNNTLTVSGNTSITGTTFSGGALTVNNNITANGTITATGDITAFFSDERLKDVVGIIPDALEKVNNLSGFYFKQNETAKALGYENDSLQVGVSAQQVKAVLPEVVKPAPINAEYLTVQYEKLVPLLIEAIKELDSKVKDLTEKLQKNGTKG